jgi:mono/diheme cytochrome c family protein
VRRLLAALAAIALLAVVAFYAATVPRGLSEAELAALPEGDAGRGETWFWAGGCSGCHAADGARGEDRLVLAGGLELQTPFGVFVAPNISPHPEDGIGPWTAAEFVDAMRRGVSPDGRHYYPSFPYTSFARMENADVADLFVYLMTLPEAEGVAPGHRLALPYSLRRGLGLWKLAFLDDAPVVPVDAEDPLLSRGRYLVEGAGHCGECHTPRGRAGEMETDRWLGGAPMPEGEGRVPNITGGEGGIGGWSAGDIAYYLETGFTPEFDTVGGPMAEVQRSIAMLEGEDRAAIAGYLKSVPPIDRR